MILTFKQKHNLDYSEALQKARLVANYVLEHKDEKLSSKNVKHFELPSAISNQVIRKYKKYKINKVRFVKLTIPNQAIQFDKDKKEIYISCLNLTFTYDIRKLEFNKINQIEIGDKYFYISVEIDDPSEYNVLAYIGVDLNTTGHCAVVACKATNKVMKLGKKAKHTHTKYSNIRKRLQKAQKYNALKKIKQRERNIVRDLNHKISRKIVDYAYNNRLGIKLEDLKGIRKSAKCNKNNKDWIYSLNTWSYSDLDIKIGYKSKMLGVPTVFVDPAYTSQTCSRCGELGKRNGKKFKCPHCGHTCHSDVNAGFNLCEWEVEGKSPKDIMDSVVDALLSSCESRDILRSCKENDLYEGSTDKPEVAMSSIKTTTNPCVP